MTGRPTATTHFSRAPAPETVRRVLVDAVKECAKKLFVLAVVLTAMAANESDNQAPSIDTTRLSELKRDLHSYGFDIFHPFLPKWYNRSISRDNLQKELICLPETGRGFLIGNTKQLWPCFKEWYRRQPDSLQDPLDTYCRESIERCCSAHFDSSSFSIYWSSKTEPDKLVSMQRVAMESGFAYHDPTTQLTIHPLYGPWNSYRAVVILHDDTITDETTPPPRIPYLLTSQEEKLAKEAMKHALSVSDISNLCHQLHGGTEDPDIETVSIAWIAVRDCIETGKTEYRYDEDQLMYHYTKDLKYLKDT